MTTIKDIYEGAERLVNLELRKEMIAQGHHLTGEMENSLEKIVYKDGKADVMEGYAAFYAKIVNEGFPAKSASMKQFPFLLEYFIKRGYPIASTNPGTLTAGALAAMTIKKWMKEGMPTAASSRFSSVIRRKRMIENAFDNMKPKLDKYLTDSYDFVVEERFQKEKSETI
jgi:hypothetical protein